MLFEARTRPTPSHTQCGFERRRHRAKRGASGARLWRVGLRISKDILSRGAGGLARWASWDRAVPGWILKPGQL
eukprot:14634254-Alexandrium_andersonii.AAC.1